MNIKAKVQVGIYKKYFNLQSNIEVNFRPGLFHKLINPSNKKELYVLELETLIKKDVIRFEDKYGRKSKPYEGKSFLKR